MSALPVSIVDTPDYVLGVEGGQPVLTRATSTGLGTSLAPNVVVANGGVTLLGNTAATPGAINITAGANAAASGTGAPVNLTSGAAVGPDGDGGPINIIAGDSALNSGHGGTITIRGGLGQSSPQQGGPIHIEGGRSVNGGTGAPVRIRPGTGSTRYGNIQLDGGRGAALNTNATGGFVTVPTCAGTPTGVPNAADIPTGSVATIVDSTNLRVYFYIAGAWRYAQMV